jgi:chromosome segregation ATPase
MTIFSRILAFANFIAAVVTIYFLIQAFVARMAWQRELRRLEEERDGVTTAELEQLIRRDYPEDVQKLEKDRPQSEAAWRADLLRKILFPPEKPGLLADPDKTQDSIRRTEELIRRYGLKYDEVRSVVEEHIGRVRKELDIEEQTLKHRRRELETLRATAQTAIREAEERLKSLQQQVATELAQHQKIRELIHQRRLQIAFWLARLSEAYAAREVAAARLRDMEDERLALEKEAQELEKTCLELLKQIEELELKLLPRSRP